MGHGVVLAPLRQAALAQEVPVVPQQFFEAGAGHPHELQLHFLGRAAHLAALTDVLVAAPRRLDHLVVSPGARVDEAATKLHRRVIYQL